MTGPSSIQGAQVMRLKKANCTVTTDSHFLDLNSAQPSVMSCHRLRRAVAFPALPGRRCPGRRRSGRAGRASSAG